MKLESHLAPDLVQAELGRRLARRRLDLGLTQAAAAEAAGIAKRTLERIETGADTQLSTLLRLLRVLDLLDGVERLVPDLGPSPMALLQLKGKERHRVATRRVDPDHDGVDGPVRGDLFCQGRHLCRVKKLVLAKWR